MVYVGWEILMFCVPFKLNRLFKNKRDARRIKNIVRIES